MRYIEQPPAPALVPFVECFWVVRDSRRRTNRAPDRILPDGCPEWIVHAADSFARHAGGRWHVQPRSFIAGTLSRPWLVRAGPQVRTLGIRFRPGALAALFGTSLAGTCDREIALGSVVGLKARRLPAAVRRERTTLGMMRTAEDELLRIVNVRRPMKRQYQIIVDTHSRTHAPTQACQRVNHRIADEMDPIGRHTLCQQIPPPAFFRNEIERADHIRHNTIDFLGHPSVETSKTCLDMRNGNMELRRYQGCRQRGIHITVYNDHRGASFQTDRFETCHDAGGLLCMGARTNTQIQIGFPKPEIFKEDVGHVGVIMLPCMDKDMLHPIGRVEGQCDWRGLHKVGASADNADYRMHRPSPSNAIFSRPSVTPFVAFRVSMTARAFRTISS